MYDGPIIDSHHHLWDLSMQRHPWLSSSEGSVPIAGMEKIQKTYVIEDFQKTIADFPVVGSVHIEALWLEDDRTGETAWLDTLDKSAGLATRYVAGASFGTERAAQQIAGQADNPRVTGFRSVISNHPEEGKCFVDNAYLAFDEAWRRDVAMLAERGLNLELLTYPFQMQAIREIARLHPDMRIVINHCFSPIDRDEIAMARWRDALAYCAQAENIFLKVSNAGHYDPERSFESLSGVISDCISAFGVERCLFGSDYPVAKLNMTYADIIDTQLRATSALGKEAQRRYFHDNAVSLYGFDS